MFARCRCLLRPNNSAYIRTLAVHRLHFSQYRTAMSSSSSSSSANNVSPAAEPTAAPQDHNPPALPAPPADDDGHIKLDMSTGNAEAKLDSMGPLVVHEDGTVSRINNWREMSEIERQNTLRVLGKRNKLRLAKLRGETAA
ncbi:hypothetical protein TD95_001969 [Thielaviopsis punctulata]|uniref:Uncharacterized protein n=1 Tax=Thielaviopsis punctulata TaxID=72032 RepID=A0A0F4ZC54_9PEZI|nr:hypothetical protein TD95_001969 [Thielaviopsis punctulata]